MYPAPYHKMSDARMRALVDPDFFMRLILALLVLLACLLLIAVVIALATF